MERKADVKRDNLSNHHLRKSTEQLLITAGKAVRPIGFDYLGTACVHYYVAESGMTTNAFAFIQHTVGMNEVPEQAADAGHKELKTTLMKIYGRREK